MDSSKSIGKGAKARQKKLTSTYGCCTMPSEGVPARFNLSRQVSLLRKIPFSSLKVDKYPIGKGVFGKCFSGFMSSHIKVCVKAFRTDEHLGCTFPIEAVLTSTLCHSNLPWFYGLSEHNDIKSDNIMIDNRSSIPQSILIDFGKGCFISDGKVYKLSLQEQQRYAIEHPQVAPDLHDGHCRQSQYSDVYSLGSRLMINFFTFHSLHHMPHIVLSTYVPKGHLLMQRMLMPS